MASLVITGRPGIMVVSGYVKYTNGPDLIIENDCLMHDGTIQKKRLRILFSRNQLQSKYLQKDAFILATVQPTTELTRILNGRCNDDTTEYFAHGFNLRYTGSFDFPEFGTTKEEHVFCGTVPKFKTVTYKGQTWSSLHVTWRKNGKELERQLLHPSDISQKMQNIKKCIVVTGPEQRGKGNRPYYFMKKIVTVA